MRNCARMANVVARTDVKSAKTVTTWTREDAIHVVMQYQAVSNVDHLINVQSALVNSLQ